MFSVGILSGEAKWSQVLEDMVRTSGITVNGCINPLESGAPDTQQLIDFSDLVWIPEKINGGMDEAVQVIRRSRHLSLGFPVSEFMEEAHFLVKLAHEARVQVQAGHPDWHSPAFRSSLIRIVQPQSIRIADSLPGGPPEESHRQVFKTILADLDLALGISGSSVRKVRPHASRMPDGTAFEVDIRVEMHNGSVVHLLIRKFADRPSRTIEIVQSDGIISIDLTAGTSHMEAYRVSESGPVITGKTLWPPAGDTGDHRQLVPHSEQEVARQCLSFIHALQRGRHPLSSLEGGFKALEITRQIEISLGTF